MLNQRLEAALKVREHLLAFESAIDSAVASGAMLAAAMPEARKTANISALFGQDALGSVADAVTLVVQARARAIDAHKALDETRSQLGLPARCFGNEVPKPPIKSEAQPAAVPLTVVA